ncbi:uncharacterized protein LOC111398309 [Olea europaea var. sylvestris]|uniref:uncharacterized protein LOC111398309 n=1 Tax=Olea europaea var. sylvestris TaxID=158386 RepID=UPI000C1D760D|nr:uncharacterized protein LOC111398309 [Olea europaea var. sylvestris]
MQNSRESLHEYWERFKRLCASCPHHQISEQLLIQYFYEGLLPTDRSMIDVASGGALVDKTPEGAKNLIANMATNSQQFGTRLDTPSRHVNEVNVSSLEQQLASLTSLVRQMAAGNMQTTKACGICSVMGHPTDMCPTLQEDPNEQVNAMGLDNHKGIMILTRIPTTQDGGIILILATGVNRKLYPPKQQQGQTSNSSTPLEDIVKSLATNTLQFQQETRTSIKSLENQMGKMATSINKLEAEGSGKLPSQTMVNPKENVGAILLRSGKNVEISRAAPTSLEQEKKKYAIEEKIVPNDDGALKRKFPPLSEFKPIPHFPQALAESRKDEPNEELYETFRKCEVNIPLLDAIKQVSHYDKFLKELCTIKRKQKLKRCENKNVGEKNVSTIIQQTLPTKCKDPGMFTIPCMIGNARFEKVVLDSRASTNVMPYSIYASLKLRSLNETVVVIQLADKSNAYTKGVVEDVLVKINYLIFLLTSVCLIWDIVIKLPLLC